MPLWGRVPLLFIDYRKRSYPYSKLSTGGPGQLFRFLQLRQSPKGLNFLLVPYFSQQFGWCGNSRWFGPNAVGRGAGCCPSTEGALLSLVSTTRLIPSTFVNIYLSHTFPGAFEAGCGARMKVEGSSRPSPPHLLRRTLEPLWLSPTLIYGQAHRRVDTPV